MSSISGFDTWSCRKFTCNIFHYLLFYTKLCFYLCILPFYPKIKDGKLKFKRYLPHQIVCFIIHISCLYYGLTSFWPMGSLGLYQFVMYAVVNIGILVFIINCWCVKPNPYKGLLQHSFKIVDSATNPSTNYLKFLVALLLWVHVIITGYPDVSRLSATLNITLEKESPVIYLKLVMTICFVILFQIAVSVQYALAAVSMFYIGNRFQTLANGEYLILGSPTLNWQSSSLERLMDYYLTVKHLTKVINRTYGIAIIIDFISVLPALGLGLSYIFPTGEAQQGIYLVDHIRTVYTLTRMYILALLAANGSTNVQEFAEVAFEQLWKSRGLENHDARKLSLITHHVKSSCVGVGGEPFFVITYKFIGSMTSTLITYTVLMIQFH